MKIEPTSRPWIKSKSYGSTTKNPFYNSTAWRTLRNAFIKANPKCIECGQPATVADHKVRIKEGGAPLDPNNLQAMCQSCHNRKDNNVTKRK